MQSAPADGLDRHQERTHRMIGVSSQRKLQFRRGIRPGSFLPMLKELNMPDQPVTTPASEFQLEVAITILKNGVPWTRQTTQSMQMDQSNAVIAQHVVVESVRQPLFKKIGRAHV